MVVIRAGRYSQLQIGKVARFLTPRYRVIVPDEIGFAESSHPEDADYGSRAQAEHVRALICTG
jgi:pimeloyl-ACP methyl ester carboxylesterase